MYASAREVDLITLDVPSRSMFLIPLLFLPHGIKGRSCSQGCFFLLGLFMGDVFQKLWTSLAALHLNKAAWKTREEKIKATSSADSKLLFSQSLFIKPHQSYSGFCRWLQMQPQVSLLAHILYLQLSMLIQQVLRCLSVGENVGEIASYCETVVQIVSLLICCFLAVFLSLLVVSLFLCKHAFIFHWTQIWRSIFFNLGH